MEEKFDITYKEKEQGNLFFKEREFEEASKSYSKALLAFNFLLKENQLEETDIRKLVNEIQIPCLLNISACLLELEVEYDKVIIHCSGVLNIDRNNLKAYYRRAQAYYYVGKYTEALEDIESARRLESSNEQLIALEKKVRQAIESYKVKEKQMAMNMVDPKIKGANFDLPLKVVFGKSILEFCKSLLFKEYFYVIRNNGDYMVLVNKNESIIEKGCLI